MKNIKIDAGIRLAALGNQSQRGVEAGAERSGGAEFQGQLHSKRSGPLCCLGQGHDGALQAGRIYPPLTPPASGGGKGGVSGNQQRGNPESLAQIEAAFEMVVVRLTL